MNCKLYLTSVLLLLAMTASGIAGCYGMGIKPAFAQASDNSSDLGVPLDNPAADLGLDNSTNSSSGASPANSTSGTATSAGQNTVTTPEFGSIAPLVLVISIIGIVIVSARARIGFR